MATKLAAGTHALAVSKLGIALYDKEGELASIVNDTVERGGNVIIPAFAVGRTQVLLYYFQKLFAEGKIPEVPIYVDSPMASKATQITLTNPDEYDEEARALYAMQAIRLRPIVPSA